MFFRPRYPPQTASDFDTEAQDTGNAANDVRPPIANVMQGRLEAKQNRMPSTIVMGQLIVCARTSSSTALTNRN